MPSVANIKSPLPIDVVPDASPATLPIMSVNAGQRRLGSRRSTVVGGRHRRSPMAPFATPVGRRNGTRLVVPEREAAADPPMKAAGSSE